MEQETGIGSLDAEFSRGYGADQRDTVAPVEEVERGRAELFFVTLQPFLEERFDVGFRRQAADGLSREFGLPVAAIATTRQRRM